MGLSRQIMIASGKGGVGKTTLTVNLGKALARKKQRVVIVDLDFCLSNLDVLARVEDKIVFDINDCIARRCRVKQALLQDFSLPSLFVLPSDTKGAKANVRPQDIQTVVCELSQTFDYCLFDCPAGIGDEFELANQNANEIIAVTTQHLTSIRDCSRLEKQLSDEIASKYIVLNRYRPDLAKKGKMLNAQQVFGLLAEFKPIGIVPEDEKLDCLDSDEQTEKYFDLVADNLHNGKNKLMIFEKGRKFF